jgi:hypothetical protein
VVVHRILPLAGIAIGAGALAAAAWGSQTQGSAAGSCDAAGVAVDAEEQELINQERTRADARFLYTWSGLATRAAAWKAHDMVNGGSTGSTDSLGRSFPARAADCGITVTTSEVLRIGTSSPSAVIEMLMGDACAKALVIDPATVQGCSVTTGNVAIGIGHEAGMWSIVFVTRQDDGPPATPVTATPTRTASPPSTTTGSPAATSTPATSSSPTAGKRIVQMVSTDGRQ